MVSVSELFNTWKEGFANRDSSKLAELLTDDFQFISPRRPMNKQETLDWTAGGGNPTAIDNLEVLYENDEVGVIYHSASNNNNDGVAIDVYTKRGDKISSCRVVRTAI
jgi:ketosteroid isomerase-like protein